jgi:archaellum component FlaC
MNNEIEAQKKIKDINKRLAKIEKKFGRIDIPVKIDIKKGFNKILNILDNMLKEDAKEYKEIGSRKVGNLKSQHGLRIRFIDDGK